MSELVQESPHAQFQTRPVIGITMNMKHFLLQEAPELLNRVGPRSVSGEEHQTHGQIEVLDATAGLWLPEWGPMHAPGEGLGLQSCE